MSLIVEIRAAQADDAAAIAAIYNHYIKQTTITFEEVALEVEVMAERLATLQTSGYPWLALTTEQGVQGYAYAAAFHPRSAYRYTVTPSVYLHSECFGRGWGTRLYEALFEALVEADCHAAIAIITLPNPASVALHEKLGFTKVAHLSEVGFKFERWLDVGYWQRLL